MSEILDIVDIYRMSQWNNLPPGSKRTSEFPDRERSRSYCFPLPQQLHTTRSSEASTSPHSSQEGQTSKSVGQLRSPTAEIGISSDIIGTRVDAMFHPSSSTPRLLTLSPTSSATFTLPPIALSSPRPVSYASHSDNLPQKFRTDNLATQTLQHENADLISAYVQAQSCIAELNTKVQASYAENERLAKDRQRLKGQVELLEAHLEEMEQSMQEVQKHTAAKDAQYSRIMELSTRLQSQGAAERHEWSCEKKSMQNVIDALNNETNGLRKVYAKSTNLRPSTVDDCRNGIGIDPDAAPESSSRGLLAEMQALRRTNARMGDVLAGIRADSSQLVDFVSKLGRIEQNIQSRLQEAETTRCMLDVFPGEEARLKEPGSRANE